MKYEKVGHLIIKSNENFIIKMSHNEFFLDEIGMVMFLFGSAICLGGWENKV